MKKFKLVVVNTKYCDYLRKFDDKVPYNFSKKENRPFVGVLFKINDIEYFAPLSSPKTKHLKMKNTIDFFKIADGKLGAINFNNMIPILKSEYNVIDFNKKINEKEEYMYNELLKDQLNYLNENYNQICNKSYRLYNLYINNKLKKEIKDRCCNFKLLEKYSLEYNSVLV